MDSRECAERSMNKNAQRERLSAIPAVIVLLLTACSLQSCYDRKSSPVSTDSSSIPNISLNLVASGFSKPVGIANAGDGSGRLFIVEQGGLVKIIKGGVTLAAPFLDVSSRLKSSSGEQGLLGIAFPPVFSAAKPFIYTNYTGTAGVGDTVIARYTVTANSDTADPASEQILLRVAQPFVNHNGGQLAFGPDGYLYLGLGDGGSGGDPFNNAQNPLVLLGKMLRIDVSSGTGTYSIPSSNPFVGNPAYRPEIWALGLRNPWRFSFDRQTGDLFIADVGQNTYEEVNLQPAASTGGANYGWNIMEGLHCYSVSPCNQNGLKLPIIEYDHSQGDCSIIGGYIYRGVRYPALEGIYLYGDYCSGRIWGLKLTGTRVENKLLLDSGMSLSTFGEDEEGNIYVADHSSGNIYEITSP
jgi:glucose/arabinose dehydrogenase